MGLDWYLLWTNELRWAVHHTQTQNSLKRLHYGGRVHSSETFPHSRAPICSLIGDFEQGRVKGGLQAKVSLLLKSHIPNEFPLIFSRRFRTLALDQASSPLLDRPIRGTFLMELKRSLNSLPNSTSMCLLRTWSNGWFTSSRMHDSKVLPCIFGCDADDSLCHYLKCEPFWTVVYSLWV